MKCINQHKGCTARANCKQNGDCFSDFQLTIPHSDNCSPNLIDVIHAQTKATIVQQVTQGGYDFQSAFSNVVTSGPNSLLSSNEEAAGSLNKQALQRKVQRKIASTFPPAPTSHQIEFLDSWKHLMGEASRPEFLLINHTFLHENSSHTILVFGLWSVFLELCGSDCWYMDGTFRVCPDPFYQLFTIHYFFSDHSIPGLYCLLTAKTEFVYKRLFTLIKDKADEHQVVIRCRRCMTDFEIAITNGVRFVWPQWVAEGCHFHFTQALYRRMEKLGLKVPSLKVNIFSNTLF